ncbi:MAG TPA: NAD+ synthase [Candidatus Aminicenantes bacterium]|nr:MAG: NAD(+) synthetase [Candidatus Aminicenantes bacterium]HEK86382.1 NAD+ synthase [Candidatus Aminicenantes bacterium]
MKINCRLVVKILTNFIREESKKAGFDRVILGLSGGLDSTVGAYLGVQALGPERVLALIMPYKDFDYQGIQQAEKVAGLLKITWKKIDISPQIEAYYSSFPTESQLLKGNKMARERMSILYDFSAREKAMILGTSNKTELLIGYGTIHGDMAYGINPLGDLYKTQVRELGRYLNVPQEMLNKKPTAGLWPGQSDEEEIGLTYEELDSILYRLVDLRQPASQIIEAGFEETKVRRVIELIKKSEFKRKMPPIAKLSNRSIGHDFLYPYDWDK